MPEQSLTNATGHKLEGEIAVVRELTMEDKILDYEKVLATKLSGEVKEGSPLYMLVYVLVIGSFFSPTVAQASSVIAGAFTADPWRRHIQV